MADLSNLTVLSLSHNQLSGGIPAALGDLSNLAHLSLRSNQLTGPIPSSLSRLANLRVLSLRFNRFSGPIPAWLGNLTNLERLYLSYNLLSGEIPPELGNLSNLTLLYLQGNQLTGCIPNGLRDISENDLDALGLPFCGDGTPDLVVEPFSVSDNNPDTGGPLVLYASVQNVGDGRLESARLTYYLSDDDTISGRDSAIPHGRRLGPRRKLRH